MGIRVGQDVYKRQIRNQYLDGGYGLDCAQDTAAVMDKAVKAILDQCYQDAVELIRENLEDMHKVVAYLLEKETITGGEMVAIIQGRDPALVEDAYASTQGRSRSLTGDIEPPAKNIHIVSEPVSAPQLPDGEPEQSEMCIRDRSRGYPAISRSSSGLVRHAICTAVRMFRSTAVHFRPQRLPTSQ